MEWEKLEGPHDLVLSLQFISEEVEIREVVLMGIREMTKKHFR